MGWAHRYIEELKAGKVSSFRPRGYSMSGKIENGQLCTVIPVTSDMQLYVGDVVLCRVHGMEYLHLIKAIDSRRVQIGNNKGGING